MAQKLLESVALNTVVNKKQLITFRETSTVNEALETFHKQGIHSAPVVDEDSYPYGSIDLLDIVSYLATKLDPDAETTTLSDKQLGDFLKYPVIKLMDFSGRNAWHSLPSLKSVKRAVFMLSNPKIHRIFLTDMHMMTESVVTQMDLIQFLLQNKIHFSEVLRQKVGELWPESRGIRSIDTESTLLQAFKKMHLDHVSGLAVVDTNGVLKGCISASDLANIKFSNLNGFWRNLNQPLDMILSMKEKRAALFGYEPHFEPEVVSKEDSLEKIMEKCLHKKVHRVFEVDSNFHPISEISLGDMIAQFQFL